jgi:hypothetical protein
LSASVNLQRLDWSHESIGLNYPKLEKQMNKSQSVLSIPKDDHEGFVAEMVKSQKDLLF